ncbi:phosphoglucosamine mutase [Candidatus Marinamargulisbacteria bacterium SCGC AG-410-N11]|nr:phosphoglucosamine mutase [Candidatus Marinamargulisbacteria bacterium SCGC AG-410-N11]
MSKLIMSMSGVRGIVGESLTPEIVQNIALAFGTYVGKGPIILGGDTRPSYDMIHSTVVGALLSVGIDIIDIGQVPTPTVQQMIKFYKAKGGIVITASHNPIIWNGIKLMSGLGSFLNEEEHRDFMEVYDKQLFNLKSWDNIGSITKDTQAITKHVDIILDTIDVDSIKNKKLKVLVDVNNGTGALANPELLSRLGVEFDILNSDPKQPFAHNPEPVKDNLVELQKAMKQGNYDIGFAQDADADRLVIIDEQGRFIGEDYSLAYCIDYLLRFESGKNKKVVVNLSTSRVIEDISSLHNAETIYTKIGESNVTEGLRENQATVGGEGNGGVIYPRVGWGRDSLVGIVVALKHLAESNCPVSEVVSTYPSYIMSREKISVDNRDDINQFLSKIELLFEGNKLDRQDGVKVIFDDSWVHVRPSNTEPIIRIFVEAPNQEIVDGLLTKIATIK